MWLLIPRARHRRAGSLLQAIDIALGMVPTKEFNNDQSQGDTESSDIPPSQILPPTGDTATIQQLLNQ